MRTARVIQLRLFIAHSLLASGFGAWRHYFDVCIKNLAHRTDTTLCTTDTACLLKGAKAYACSRADVCLGANQCGDTAACNVFQNDISISASQCRDHAQAMHAVLSQAANLTSALPVKKLAALMAIELGCGGAHRAASSASAVPLSTSAHRWSFVTKLKAAMMCSDESCVSPWWDPPGRRMWHDDTLVKELQLRLGQQAMLFDYVHVASHRTLGDCRRPSGDSVFRAR